MKLEINFKTIQSKQFFNLLSHEEISQKYNCLGPKKQQLFQGVYDRCTFTDLIEENYLNIIKIINPKFIRSLQGYLLLSCGDALGAGANFYSFDTFLNESDNPDRDNLIKNHLDSSHKTPNKLIQIIKDLWSKYTNRQSVKQSFFTFWRKRSSTIKEKLFYCYTPFSQNQDASGLDDQKFLNEIIRKRLYESYRNPFTHNAQNNFPQLIPDLLGYPDPNLAKAVVYTEYHRKDGKKFKLKVPLTFQEAKRIIETEGTLHHRLLDKSLMQLTKPSDPWHMVRISIESRGGVPERNKEGKIGYVHPGTLDILRMAIAEASAEMLGLSIDWEALYN